MTKPNDIPQDVWDKAVDSINYTSVVLLSAIEYDDVVINIARAIMAAKEEEREECARQVETGQGWITDYLIGGKSFSPLIAAAIRNRKLANNTNKD